MGRYPRHFVWFHVFGIYAYVVEPITGNVSTYLIKAMGVSHNMCIKSRLKRIQFPMWKNAQSGPNINVKQRKVCRGDQECNPGCRLGVVAFIFRLDGKNATIVGVYVFSLVVFMFIFTLFLASNI